MREIKFRAWGNIKNHPRMHYLTLFNIGCDVQGLPFCVFGEGDYNDEDWAEDVNDYILMQYTGLLDKNGKEIYEGDIIQTDFSGVGKVVFDMAEFAIDFPYDDSRHLYCYKSREVIGNIYETPELLK